MKCAVPFPRLLAVLVIAPAIAGVWAQSADVYPMPRDATIADLVSAYSPATQCTARMLSISKITLSECTLRVATARKDCRTLIAEDLPSQLDEKQTNRLVARSQACVFLSIHGRPYSNVSADQAAEKMWARHHGG